MPDTDNLKRNYDEMYHQAKRLMDALRDQLLQLLNQNNITLAVPLECRIKKFDSIAEKIQRKELDITCVTDLPDFVGFRLILLFNRDQIQVDKIIQQSLNILSREDTSARLTEGQFGYKSFHYTVNMPDEWLKVPTFSGLGNISVEMQVRTLAQHMWAAASHKLQYKIESNVPVPIRRSINRVSALLETVDLEFERVLEEREAYIKQLDTNDGEQILNVDSIEHLLDEMLPKNNKDLDEDYPELIDELNYCGVTTIDALRVLVKKHLTKALEEDTRRVPEEGFSGHEERERALLGVYFTHAGLTRMIIDEEYGEKRKEFLDKKRRNKLFSTP